MSCKINAKFTEFGPGAVHLCDAYCANALNKETAYLLALEPDRLLAGFREVANLAPKSIRYPGWEVTEIAGHTLGHYLTAVAQAFAVTGDDAYKQRLQTICEDLRQCQRPDGYLFASTETLFNNVEQKKPAWVPWYTMHKLLAGLFSAATLAGLEIAKEVACRLGNWISQRALGWDAETRTRVLTVEYGGMNDALYDLYRLCGDAKFLAAAHVFDEETLFEPLAAGQDRLDGLHANTTIPKILGALNRYMLTGEEFYLRTAQNFWEIVVDHHTYITGGNSEWERFGEPDILDRERTACNCETCNCYNMLKLSERLFCLTGTGKYMDFYATTWLNAILASQNPETGMTMYFQPMETGFFKVFGKPFSNFWCCTGTGMENFTKLQEGVFFTSGERIVIARYTSAVLQDVAQEVSIAIQAEFPVPENVKITVNALPAAGKIMELLVPSWCQGMQLTVNGTARQVQPRNDRITLQVHTKDVVELRLTPAVTAHILPDNPNCAAFCYGPVLLCASLGAAMMETDVTGVEVSVPTKIFFVKDYLILDGEDPADWLAKVTQNLTRKPGKALRFTLHNTDEDARLEFVPYFSQYKERYGIYWKFYRRGSLALATETAQSALRQHIARSSLDMVPIGNEQYELAHAVCGENTSTLGLQGHRGRQITGDGWFEYTMKTAPSGCLLAVTYCGMDAGAAFEIRVNGTLLKAEALETDSSAFYTVFYLLPATVLAGNTKAKVCFTAKCQRPPCRIFQILYTIKDDGQNGASYQSMTKTATTE